MCLALSPLEEETTKDAHEHIQFLSFVLELFVKSIKNVVAFAGYNYNVNPAISSHMGVPLIGCASHHFRFAVNENLHDHEVLLTIEHYLLVKL